MNDDVFALRERLIKPFRYKLHATEEFKNNLKYIWNFYQLLQVIGKIN